MYDSNRFKTGDHCTGCFFYAGFCLAPGSTISKLPCDPVDRLYESLKPKRGYAYLKNDKAQGADNA